MAEGVDVSRHQGSVNWGAARGSGITFAYIKVTEGIGYVDPKVDQHLTGARQGGVIPGLYHFGRPDTNTGAQDGAHFAAEVNARSAAGPGNLPPCLDLEETKPGQFAGLDLVSYVSDFLATARKATGRRQFMLYGSAYFLRDRLDGLGWLDRDCLLWIAHYGRTAGQPGWKDDRTVMHQYTSTGRITGYTANIDRNLCWVDLATLTGGGSGTPAPPPPPPPPGGEYVVKAGDTLSGIAAKLNFPGGWQALYALNRDRIGDDPNHIQPGWRLHTTGAPAAPAPKREYTVLAGESLTRIAQKLGIDGGWQAIYNANRDRIKDPDVIFPGQKLRLP